MYRNLMCDSTVIELDQPAHSFSSEPHQLLFVGKLLPLAEALALWVDMHSMFEASLVVILKRIRFCSDQLCDCNLALVSLCRLQVGQSVSAYSNNTEWQDLDMGIVQ